MHSKTFIAQSLPSSRKMEVDCRQILALLQAKRSQFRLVNLADEQPGSIWRQKFVA